MSNIIYVPFAGKKIQERFYAWIMTMLRDK